MFNTGFRIKNSKKHEEILYVSLFIWAFICKFAPRLAIVQ